MSSKRASARAPARPQPGARRSTSPRRGRPVGDHEAKRGELLAVASAVIEEEGYSAATIRRVAERAGCSTGVVTYYFANKEDLIAAVVDDVFGDFDSLFAPGPGADFEVRTMLERALLPRKSRVSPWAVWLEISVRAGTDPVLAALNEQGGRAFRARLEAQLERCQLRGAVRADVAADLLADEITALIDGLLLSKRVEPTRFSDERVRSLIDVAVSMVSGERRTSS